MSAQASAQARAIDALAIAQDHTGLSHGKPKLQDLTNYTPAANLTRETRGDETFARLAAVQSGPKKRTKLMYYAKINDAPRIDFILFQISPDLLIDLQDTDGKTALMHATVEGGLTSIYILLRNGADPDITDISGFSPLMVASNSGYVDIVKLLLDGRANVNYVREGDAGTSLMYATRAENKNIVEILLDNGANVNAESANIVSGCNSLVFACQKKNKEIAQLLIQRGVDVSAARGFMMHYNEYYKDALKFLNKIFPPTGGRRQVKTRRRSRHRI
jgi:hypothetical protein